MAAAGGARAEATRIEAMRAQVAAGRIWRRVRLEPWKDGAAEVYVGDSAECAI